MPGGRKAAAGSFYDQMLPATSKLQPSTLGLARTQTGVMHVQLEIDDILAQLSGTLLLMASCLSIWFMQHFGYHVWSTPALPDNICSHSRSGCISYMRLHSECCMLTK